MYVRARGRAGYRVAEGREGDARRAQVLHQRAPLRAVGTEAHVHSVVMVEAPAVVHGRLAERTYGELTPELLREELLDRARLRQRPSARSAVAYVSRRRDEAAARARRARRTLRRDLFGLLFDQRLGDLLVGALQLAPHLRDLRARLRRRRLFLLKLAPPAPAAPLPRSPARDVCHARPRATPKDMTSESARAPPRVALPTLMPITLSNLRPRRPFPTRGSGVRNMSRSF